MKIAFFGLPLAALALARDGHEVVYAAICRKHAIGTRRLLRRLGPGVVDIVPDANDDATFSRFVASSPDLLVSWFWTKKLPGRYLRLPRHGAFGVHPSLLPRHRGPDPYFWTIDAGDAKAGVTAHVLDEAYDTGAIYGSRSIPVDPSWDAWDLARALDRPSLALLRETARAFAAGTPPVATPQDDAAATDAPSPGDDDLVLDWSGTAERIARRIRAAAPWPGAITQIGDKVVTITRATPTTRFPRALLPGEAALDGGIPVVRAGEGALVLRAGRIEGDDEGAGDGAVDVDEAGFVRLVTEA